MPDNNAAKGSVIITGASSGIGAATALLVAQAGYDVCVSFRSDEMSANKVVDEIVKNGGRAIAVAADVRNQDEVAHLFVTTQEQLGAIAVACRRHANLTPGAVMHHKPLSLEDYLSRPMLVDPLRVEDCCLISDGGAAFIMSSLERARDLQQPPIEVAGVGEAYSGTGTYWSQQPAFTSTPQVYSAPPAFAMAGLEPKDVDVLTLYDPFTIVALMQIEDMGFCKKGEGGPFVEGQTLHFDGGGLPYNTHGGLLSHAYVLGIAHVVEVVRQLRGQAAAQVPGARVGVYGGYTGHMASTLILRRF